MKRPLSLTASILSIVGQGIASIEFLIAFIVLMESAGYYGSSATGQIILIGLMLSVSVISLIFSILVIPAWNKDKTKYKKKKALIITASVLNFVTVLYLMILMFTTYYLPAETAVFFVFVIGLLVASNILWYIDLGKEAKRESNVATAVAEAPASHTAQASTSVENKVQAADEFAQKLAKLTALKNSGVLSEEEFTEIKKSYIKDYVK